MNCGYCNYETHVLETRATNDGVRRRRECDKCGKRVSTRELPDEYIREMRGTVKEYERLLQKLKQENRGT